MLSNMIWGTPSLTKRGEEAVKDNTASMPVFHRSILSRVDGQTSLFELHKKFYWSLEVDEGLQYLVKSGYIEISKTVNDQLKEMFVDRLGKAEAQIMITKLDGLCIKNGPNNVGNVRQLELTVELFFGKEKASMLSAEIKRVWEFSECINRDKAVRCVKANMAEDLEKIDERDVEVLLSNFTSGMIS